MNKLSIHFRNNAETNFLSSNFLSIMYDSTLTFFPLFYLHLSNTFCLVHSVRHNPVGIIQPGHPTVLLFVHHLDTYL